MGIECGNRPSSAFAESIKTEEEPMYFPVEVSLKTDQYEYKNEEVVHWEVSIAGGDPENPNLDVRFTDTTAILGA